LTLTAHQQWSSDKLPTNAKAAPGIWQLIKVVPNDLSFILSDVCRHGFVTLTQMNQKCRPWPRSSSNNLMPFGERLGACLTESLARDQIMLHIEMIVDGIVDGQKTLHRSGRLEPAHGAFSSARRLMWYFVSIVQSTACDIKVLQVKFSKRRGI